MKKNQRIIDVLLAIVFVFGFVMTVSDGFKEFFGCTQAAQYLANFIYIVIVLPACISCSSFPQWVNPELFCEGTDSAAEERKV